jgi:hypothetical protein
VLLADFRVECCPFRYVKLVIGTGNVFDLTDGEGIDVCKLSNGLFDSDSFGGREVGSDLDVPKNFCDTLRFEGRSSTSEYGCVSAHTNFRLFSTRG